MNLSHKLTFSLASIFLLLAFAAVPVIAHDDTITPDTNEAAHTHPLLETVPADTDAEPPTTEVTTHGHHPMVTSIALKPDAAKVRDNMVVVGAAAATPSTTHATVDPNEFVLIVTFDRPVVGASGTVLPTVDATAGSDATGTLAVAEVLHSVRNKMRNELATQANITIETVVFAGTTYDTFEVKVRAVGDAIPTGTAADANEKVFLYVRIAAGAVFSAQTTPDDPNGVRTLTVPGGENSLSSREDFILVKELPATPPTPDTTKPTLTIASMPTDGMALPASGKVKFTFTFSEEPGSNDADFTIGDIDIVGGSKDDLTKAGLVYTLTVTPANAMTPVKVSVAANKVSDAAGNNLAQAYTDTYMPPDDIHPTVTISASESRESVNGRMETVITFKFDFSEDISGTHKGGFTRSDIDATESNFGRVLGEGDPVQDSNDSTIYTFKVVAASVGPTRIRLEAGSVADLSGNVLLGDQDGQYTPENIPPAIVISGPNLLAQRKFVGNNITIMVSDALGVTGVLAAGEVVITNGTKTGFAYANNRATFTVKPNVGAVRVRVTVNANSLTDNLGNGNTETSKWFNVGPVLSIPANSHLVVVKDFDRQGTFTFLSDDTRPTQGPINPVRPAILSAREIGVSNWTEMPDLERMFDYATGEGGGALVLKKAASQATLAKGAVGITEIMWASDLNRIGSVQDAEARFQWIELENLTGAAVNVHLFHRIGRETYTIENDEIDRAGNFYDASLGNNRWDVGTKGQNGNSYTGEDFISMHRNLPDFGKNHNYANVNGMDDAAWVKSTLIFLTKTARNPSDPKEYWHRGTPGRRHVHGTDGTTVRAGRTSVPSSPVIFNEVANRSNQQYEWIELRNVTSGEVNLKNYAITFVTAVDQEHLFYAFPNNNNAKIPGHGVLLLVDTDPRDNFEHPLAVGYDVDRNPEDQIDGIAGPDDNFADAPRYKITDFRDGGLPDDGKFVLTLRKPEKADGSGKPGKDYRNSAGNIVDIAGYDNDGLRKTNYPATNPANLNNTDLWPLVNFFAPNLSNNQLAVETVHYRRNHTTKDGRSGIGGAGNNENGKSAFTDVGFSGIGYKRHVTRSNALGGDPGYHSITRGKVTDLADRAVVTISEIMLSQGDRGYPQWIELYNNSRTQAVQLDADDGWRLVIENPDDPIGTINFKAKGQVKRILPNQTVLVVSGSARSAGSDFLAASTVFPATRTYNVYREVANQFAMKNRSAPFVNPKAFHIKLIDGKGNLSDEIGNLDGKARTNDTAKWEYPEGMTEGRRTSLIRVYDDGVAREGVNMATSNVAPLGTKGVGKNQNPVDKTYSWVHAVDTDAAASRFVRHTWYGVETDHGTPGTRRGQILPVELSFFRPTLENGQVTIQWTTESELDNAGFNILRSDTRNGEFTQVNEQMIQGKGTTAERSTYKWVDTTAKPGVVYYYQIEDVSYAGEHTKLATTKLKGLISAKGKLTTQWGELKNLR